MAFQPVPNTMEIVVRQQLHGIPVVNVLHATGSAQINATQLTTVGEAVRQWWINSLRPWISFELALTGVTTRDLTSALGTSIEVPVSAGTTGASPQQSLPGNVAFVVTHSTALGGRSFRGRTYCMGLPANLVDNNTVTADYANGVAAAFNALRVTLAEGTWALAVVSRYANKQPRAAGIATPIVVSRYRDLRVDTQRRRLS